MPGSNEINVNDLVSRLLAGERRALAQAITLVESTREDHAADGDALLELLLPHAGGSVRIGISGAPGVGKSTFIEAFGKLLIGLGHKVAVLAVDPSSVRTGGSILGDKTRMEELARDANAFIRPSPSQGTLGGVARRTREAITLAEAAGYDVVIIETVGVGQSEVDVDNMADMFLLLLNPGGGDELQGIKRGIMELADLIVVNKADGDLAKQAKIALAEYEGALQLMRPKHTNWQPRVMLASALKQTGLEEIWAVVEEFENIQRKNGDIERRRNGQARHWMWQEVDLGLKEALRDDPETMVLAAELEAKVSNNQLATSRSARMLVEAFLGKQK